MDGEPANQFHGDADNVVQIRDLHGDLHVNQPQPSIRPVTPRQLPADIRQFTGRDDELRRLDSLMTPAAVVVCAITGTAGVGKTALAVRWAHRARGHFPDGQLYVDLLGYSPDAPVTPAQALEGFLHALGVSGDAVPPRLDDQAALYRSLLDGRRTLVVLDNAYSSDQVRPLLPGSSGCFVLVTTRSALAGLVARDGAQRLTLDLLSHNDSLCLLHDLVGTRVDAEPESAAVLADQCGRLPLALRVAGERAAAEPDLPLSALTGELADERGRLDFLASEDQDASSAVRAVLSWSYRNLPPAEAGLFRLLGLHPGPDFGVPVAAVLADVPVPQAKRLLRSLANSHLVQANGPGRYRFHDVPRLYAIELAEAEEHHAAAVRRMLCWYLECASTADHLLLPLFTAHPVELPEPPAVPVPFTTRDEALAWCEMEAANLVAAVRCAAQLGEHALAVQFPGALWGYYDLRKPWNDWIVTHDIGLSSARLLGDERKRARIASALGVAYYDLQYYDEAAMLFVESLAISRALGDVDTGSLDRLGSTYRKRGQFDRALECHQASLAIRLEDGNQRSVAVTLNRVGSTYRDLERFDESLDHLGRSLAIRREIGDVHGQGFALHSIGATYEQLGQLDDAMDAYRQSLAVRRAIGDRRGEAENLSCLAKILLRQGNGPEAREAWTEALAILSDLGAPQAVEVAQQLAALG